MKILVLTTKSPWPPRDGSAVASKHIIEGLSGHGADITVLSIMTQKHEDVNNRTAGVKVPVTMFKRFFIDTTIKPFILLSNLFFSTKPYDLERFYSEGFMRLIRSLPDLNEYDIIQCEGLVFALYARGIRSVTGARLVLRAHNIEHRIKEMMAQNERFLPARWYLRNLAGRIKNLESDCRTLFDAIVAITNEDKKWFDACKGDAPVVVAETGVCSFLNSQPADISGPRVGFIGALDWKPNTRGLKWFIKEVWPLVCEQIHDAALVVAGRNASHATAKVIKGTNVFFEGEVDDSVSFTSSMNVMIAPLFEGSGMRVKIIEAMNTGIPVVASAIAAQGLEVTDRQNILIADNAAEFAAAVTQMLANDAEKHRITENARLLLKEKYDNNKITSNLLGFYKVLANGH